MVRVESVLTPKLVVDWAKVPPITLNPALTAEWAELAPALGGATDLTQAKEIGLTKLPEGFRLQRYTFLAAKKAFSAVSGAYKGNQEFLLVQFVRLVETFLKSDRIVTPSLFHSDSLRRRILIALNLDDIVQHLLTFVQQQNVTALTPIFDDESPIGSTGQMRPWYTSRPNAPAVKSHISHVVGDAAWEQHAVNIFEKRDEVVAYAKNDHLGFHIHYLWQGSRRRYVPDFIVKLANGVMLAVEIKGVDSEQNKAKRAALAEWVAAVNTAGGFGVWAWDVAFDPAAVDDIVSKHAAVAHSARARPMTEADAM